MIFVDFYDKDGNPVAYELNSVIYLFSGDPVAYIYGDVVYGFGGNQLGWYVNGWIRDIFGACVLFTEKAIGLLPKRPNPKSAPPKRIRKSLPIKGFRQLPYLRTLKLLSWSDISVQDFFRL